MERRGCNAKGSIFVDINNVNGVVTLLHHFVAEYTDICYTLASQSSRSSEVFLWSTLQILLKDFTLFERVRKVDKSQQE
jgi:hypothetical protein